VIQLDVVFEERWFCLSGSDEAWWRSGAGLRHVRGLSSIRITCQLLRSFDWFKGSQLSIAAERWIYRTQSV